MQGRIRKMISIGMMTVICAAVFTSCGTSAVKDRATVIKIDGQIVPDVSTKPCGRSEDAVYDRRGKPEGFLDNGI